MLETPRDEKKADIHIDTNWSKKKKPNAKNQAENAGVIDDNDDRWDIDSLAFMQRSTM